MLIISHHANDCYLFCLCRQNRKLQILFSLRYTALTSSNKSETAVYFCDPALSVLVMLVSRNVFHVVSALQFIVFILFFRLIRSLVDPTLAALIVCSPLQLFSLSLFNISGCHFNISGCPNLAYRIVVLEISTRPIAGLHMTSLNFKLQKYLSS